jgi:omega-6 fatty acid desaturase (delta-12 desaturase)
MHYRDLLAVVPKEAYRKKPLIAWTTLALDLSMLVGISAIILNINNYFIGCILGVTLLGLVFTGLFVIGHDAGHRSFSDSEAVNDFVGHLTTSHLGWPFHLWRLAHNVHHLHTNHALKDIAWEPHTNQQVAKLPAFFHFMYRAIRSNIYAYWLGALFHNSELWMKFLNGKLYKQEDRPIIWRSIAISVSSMFLYALTAFMLGGFYGLITLFIVPLAGFYFWMTTFTLLHHTHPDLKFLNDRNWDKVQAQLDGTITIHYGRVIDFFTHNIAWHAPHHVSIGIPHYNLKAVHASLKNSFPERVHEQDFSWSHLKAVLASCQAVNNFDDCTWVRFSADSVDDITDRSSEQVQSFYPKSEIPKYQLDWRSSMHNGLQLIQQARQDGHIILYVFKTSTPDTRQMLRAFCRVADLPVPAWTIGQGAVQEAYDITLKTPKPWTYPALDAIQRLAKLEAALRSTPASRIWVCFIAPSSDDFFEIKGGAVIQIDGKAKDQAGITLHQNIVRLAMDKGFLDWNDWKAKYYEMQDTPSLMRDMLQSQNLKKAIASYAASQGWPESRVTRLASNYMKQMMSRRQLSIVNACNNLIATFLKRHFKTVRLSGFDRIRDLEGSHTIVYLPTHRSHVDFIMFPHLLTRHGLLVTHNVSSNHLTPLPFGPILRGVGGFFIYREAKDIVYRTILKDYMGAIARSGLPIMVFIEGTRSRDGSPQKPKRGILAQIIENHLQNPGRPLALVPVYIGYDKVGESESLLKDTVKARVEKKIASDRELEAFQAKRSRPKTLSIRFKAFMRKFHAKPVGNAYVHLGRPLIVDDYLSMEMPSWKQSAGQELSLTQDELFKGLSQKISTEVSRRIYEQTEVTPISLFSLGLSSAEGNMMSDENLIAFASKVRDMLKAMPYHSDLKIPQSELSFELQQCKQLPFVNRDRRHRQAPHGQAERRAQRTQPFTYLTSLDVARATLPKNNIAHLVMLPSIIAHRMIEHNKLDANGLVTQCRVAFEHALAQFSIPLSCSNLTTDELVLLTADAMVAARLLEKGEAHGQTIYSLGRSEDFANLDMLQWEARHFLKDMPSGAKEPEGPVGKPSQITCLNHVS